MVSLVLISIFGYFIITGLPQFLMHKQGIEGSVLWDPITSNFSPINFNPYIFYITIIVITIGQISSLLTPRRLLQMMYTFGFLNLVRMICLYFINLEPPLDTIPLYDPFLEKTFYEDVLITKDLFFSGHTSNIIVFAFLSRVTWFRNFFFVTAFIVASMLVMQHVHYTIDVVAAPFFAYVVYRIFERLLDEVAKKSRFSHVS